MKKLILFYSILMTSFLFAQKDIEVSYKKVNNDYTVVVRNNSQFRQKVNLKIKGSGYENINSPIIKLVNKGEALDFVTVKPKGKQSFSFSWDYNYESDPTPQEKEDITKQLENKQFSEDADLSKGLYVFTTDNCPRSEKTLNYLLKNNIDFKYANTHRNPQLNTLMYKKLKTIGVTKDFTMPVVLYNGKVTHSHKDLNEFLKTLNKTQ